MPGKHILGSGLLINGTILSNFLFHYQNGLKVGEATNAAIVAVFVIREKVTIPAHHADSVVRKHWKLYEPRFLLIQGVTV